MGATMGSLVVKLEADIAKFTSDMGRASQQTEQAMSRIGGALDTVKGGLAALGIGASVAAFATIIKGSIDAADNLRDMSQKTGIAVEALNGLGFASGQAGGSLEAMVGAAGKLNKSIAESAGGNGTAAGAFKALGISVFDVEGHLKKADVVMAQVADQFAKYQDGPEKSALALKLFGKAGADMIPMLNDGGTALRENAAYAEKYSGVTTAMSDAADNFNDTMGKLKVQQDGFVNSLTAAVLPVIQTVADELLGAAEGSNKFALAGDVARTVLETFVVVGSEVAFTFKAVGTEIGGIAAQVAALAQADIKGFNAISEAMKADAEKARKEHDEFIKKVLDRTPKPVIAADTGDTKKPKPPAPKVIENGIDKMKLVFDAQAKAISVALAQERDTAAYHESFMRELRSQGAIDVDTFNRFKVASIEQARDSAVRAYDSEIAVLKKARAAASKESEKAEIGIRIGEKVAAKEKAILDAQRARELQTLGLSAAQADLNKDMADWAAQQDQTIGQLQFANDMYGKSALEVTKLTNAMRAQVEVEQLIARAKKEGPISQESIDKYLKDAKAKADAMNAGATKSTGLGLIMSQETPMETEDRNHAAILSGLQAFRDQEFALTASANEAIRRENERHNQVMMEMQNASQMQKLALVGDSASQLYSMLQQAGMQQTALAKAAFLASKAIAVAEIIMNTNVAASKAQAQFGAWGTPIAMAIRVAGYASAGMTAGLAIAEVSAEGGYDIPAGKNPMAQLHEKEMVLPKRQADVIRGLADGSAFGGNRGAVTINYSPTIQIDGDTDMQKNRKMIAEQVAQGNADLVDRLQRAGRI